MIAVKMIMSQIFLDPNVTLFGVKSQATASDCMDGSLDLFSPRLQVKA
jgi:hypothetical protein